MSREITLKVKKIVVLKGRGPDEITLTLDMPTPFPSCDYAGNATIQTQAGEGARWCKANLGVEPDEIIDAHLGLVTK